MSSGQSACSPANYDDYLPYSTQPQYASSFGNNSPFGSAPVDGAHLLINGTWIIDIPKIMENCTIEFGPHGKIQVGEFSTSTFGSLLSTKNRFKSCDPGHMWQGIILSPANPSRFEGSVIEDAIVGLDCQGGNNHLAPQITSGAINIFRNCLIGIRAINPIQFGTLPGARIFGGPLTGTYAGKNSTVGYMIESTNPSSTNDVTFREPVTMTDLAIGIHATKVNIVFTPNSFNSSFNRIRAANHFQFSGSEDFYSDRWGTAILIERTDLTEDGDLTAVGSYSYNPGTGDLTILDSPFTISNCDAGVAVINGNVSITGGVFSNIKERGIYNELIVNTGPGADQNNISGCSFSGFGGSNGSSIGIHSISGIGAAHQITNCTLGNFQDNQTIGILIHQFNPLADFPWQTANIFNISITENNIENPRIGVQLVGGRQVDGTLSVSRNNITDVREVPLSSGIRIENIDNSEVLLNNVSGSEISVSDGFYIDACSNSLIQCNDANGLTSGFSFYNVNPNTAWRNNRMNGGKNGMSVISGYIGAQSGNGNPSYNTWVGRFSNAGIYSINSPGNLSEITYSTLQSNSSTTVANSGGSPIPLVPSSVPAPLDICRATRSISQSVNLGSSSYFELYTASSLWILDSLKYANDSNITSLVGLARGSNMMQALRILNGDTNVTLNGFTLNSTMDSVAILAVSAFRNPASAIGLDESVFKDQLKYGPFTYYLSGAMSYATGGKVYQTEYKTTTSTTSRFASPSPNKHSETTETISFFPNPTSGNIHFIPELNGQEYILINSIGQSVASGTVIQGTVSLAKLPVGVYFLQFPEIGEVSTLFIKR